jgi:uncharacterized protein YegP (UPF0339 family)
MVAAVLLWVVAGDGKEWPVPWREVAMAAKFVLQQGSAGKYHFNLVATNGQVIASSESYESKASALKGIESVKRNAAGAQLNDQTRR